MAIRTLEAVAGVASAQGLDVSNFQGNFDWAGAKRGYPALAFGIYRLTQGLGGAGMNSPDPRALHNHQGIRGLGLVEGHYHFLDPRLDGAAQARYYVDQADKLGAASTATMFWLDNEAASGQSAAHVAAVAVAFRREVRALVPHNPQGTYTFISFAAEGFCAGLGGDPLWIAHPSPSAPAPPLPWAKWTFWQWGMRNGDDADAFNGTAASLESWIASFLPPPAPRPVTPTAAPKRFIANGRQSLAQFAAARGRTELAVAWLTAQNQPQPGPAHASYLGGILAGTVRATAPMPGGMNVWG